MSLKTERWIMIEIFEMVAVVDYVIIIMSSNGSGCRFGPI